MTHRNLVTKDLHGPRNVKFGYFNVNVAMSFCSQWLKLLSFSGSPTPSDSSSQNAAVTSQALAAAVMKREETAKLTASLSNYYNEKLIGHVLGWQADLLEKQVILSQTQISFLLTCVLVRYCFWSGFFLFSIPFFTCIFVFFVLTW